MRKVGGFELIEKLGEGGSGRVFRSRDPKTGREIALKLLPLYDDPELVAAERRAAELQRRFHALAQALVEVREVGEEDGFFYVATENVPGPSVAALLAREGPLGAHRAVAVALQLCQVLEVFHSAAVKIPDQKEPLLLGEIRPEILYLEAPDRVRLFDFGLPQGLALRRAAAATGLGCTPYVSPERLRGEDLSPAADLWAVGVTLYEMVANARPFPGETDAAVRERVLAGGAPEPLPASVHAELSALLLRCLDADPSRRFRTTWELRTALEQLSIPAPAAPRRPTAPPKRRTASGTTAAKQPAAKLKSRRSKLPGRSFWWRTAVVLGVVLAVLFVLAELRVLLVRSEIEEALSEGSPPDLSKLAGKYAGAARWDAFGLLDAAAEPVEKEIVEAAETVIETHRKGESVSKEDWHGTAQLLSLAVRIDRGNDYARSRRAYCLGQLAHLEAVELAERGSGAKAHQRWLKAERHFGEAEATAIAWGAPLLGLARIYVHQAFGLSDIRKLERALRIAEGREPRLKPAERLLLLEGYERLGRIEEDRAGDLTGDERLDMLLAARRKFEKALEHCKQLDVVTRDCARRCRQHLKRVKGRLIGLE